MIQGTLENSNFYRHHFDITNGRNIDLLDGDFDSESLWQGGDSDKNVSTSSEYPLFLRWGGGDRATQDSH